MKVALKMRCYTATCTYFHGNAMLSSVKIMWLNVAHPCQLRSKNKAQRRVGEEVCLPVAISTTFLNQ
jgi:hypothetical protein